MTKLNSILDTELSAVLFSVLVTAIIITPAALRAGAKVRLNATSLSEKIEKLNAKEAYLNCEGLPVFPALWNDTAKQATYMNRLKDGSCLLEYGQPNRPEPPDQFVAAPETGLY